MTTLPSRLALAAAALPFAMSLAACGGDDPASPEVASLPTPSSHGADQPTGGKGTGKDAGKHDGTSGGRPVLRLDDSDEHRFALWNAYNKCLLQHGATKADNGMGIALPGPDGRPGTTGILLEQPVPQAARAACIQIEPMGPLELDASTNPDFHEQSLAYVDCLRDHGEYVRLLNDHDIDWTYVEGHSVPDDQAEFEEQCLLDAFGGRGSGK